MPIPEDYPDELTDELAPYGFEFGAVQEDDDMGTSVLFVADPESFVHAHPGLGIEESHGASWPPASLDLWISFDRHGDPVQISFEVFDLLAWAASEDPELASRLNSMEDPADHAVAVGEALGHVLEQERPQYDDYLD
ncbi:MAG: hypothetical protein LCH96_01190 [Actinobacteria bacterium]|nr:hypothetical protein [Actinomycetota bacterium]